MDASPGPGRRGNGLSAPDWAALVDVDPRLSEALLGRLAAAEVAAYVEPALGANTFTRAATHPVRPLDRLWVDPSRGDTARDVVGREVADLTALLAEQEPGATAHGLVHPVPRSAARRVLAPPPLPGPPVSSSPDPEPRQEDPDEAFRRIVEGFSREAPDSPVPPWPVAEDLGDEGRRGPRLLGRSSSPADQPDEPPRRRRRSDADDGLPGWVEPAPLEDEGHYVPPPPPPVPRLAPQKLCAAAALLGGLILMFAPGLLLQQRTAFVGMCGVLLTVGGSAALVYLMRDAPDDHDPDDGAVV